jgi:hypothetical protein
MGSKGDCRNQRQIYEVRVHGIYEGHAHKTLRYHSDESYVGQVNDF